MKIKRDRTSRTQRTTIKNYRRKFEKWSKQPVTPSSESNDGHQYADIRSNDGWCDVECPYCSGRFSEDRKFEKWAKCMD